MYYISQKSSQFLKTLLIFSNVPINLNFKNLFYKAQRSFKAEKLHYVPTADLGKY